MAKELVRSAAGDARRCRAREWLLDRGKSAHLLVVAETREAASSLVRETARELGATFGWERTTLGGLALSLASPALALRGLAPAGWLSVEALCDRVVGARGTNLGRFSPIADRPGLCRALARTISEARMAGLDFSLIDDRDLQGIAADFDRELAAAKLADRALVFSEAIRAAKDRTASHVALDVPLLLFDTSVTSALARDLVQAVAARAAVVLATLPAGDVASEKFLSTALGENPIDAPRDESSALARTQNRLFSGEAAAPAAASAEIEILSAPGESRECVEIARRILDEASKGTGFDRMAIVARSGAAYRAHVVEALRRAKIPAFFARGLMRPDPAGRALAALLSCAAEGLSARRFAEYLSLGELPDATEAGAPPPAQTLDNRVGTPDDDMLADPLREDEQGDPDFGDEPPEPVAEPETRPVVDGSLYAPANWERLLSDAAVIRGPDRWRRRLDGLQHEIELDLREIKDDDALADRTKKALADLDRLRRFALPIIDELASLPQTATWGKWREALARLATRALRRPDRVLSVLAELAPMDEIGDVSLSDVRLVMSPRLCQLVERPRSRRYGAVYVGEPADVRGLVFDVVFVVGVAEKVFPKKITEDPIFPDATRARVDPSLATNAIRSANERLALRLAIGAAKRRIVVSYPRLDSDLARPRTPSFYALEVLRAAEGRLPGFEELARRAEVVGGARIGWPAPRRREDAIDETEHDLALLESIFAKPESETVGMARFLLSVNAHLARALRFRALRWQKGWSYADGLVLAKQPPEAKAALERHSLAARSFSPTALQHFAACPYKFVLQAIFRLSPREEPVQIEELNPLQRGSLLHEIEYELHVRLRELGLLPVTTENLEAARAELDRVVAAASEKMRDDLAPAIPEVWDDGIRALAADAREMLRRATLDPEWVPSHFELSFGLTDRRSQDPLSRKEPVTIAGGLQVRGSIDVIDKNGKREVRATDYKTGKVRAEKDMRIGGGETLQPVFYALVLEQIMPGLKSVGGRLYYCTAAGSYTEVDVPLDDEAREGAQAIVKVVGDAIANGFLPAAPNPDGYGCEYCDYLPICGPYEVHRTNKVKSQKDLQPLVQIRARR